MEWNYESLLYKVYRRDRGDLRNQFYIQPAAYLYAMIQHTRYIILRPQETFIMTP